MSVFIRKSYSGFFADVLKDPAVFNMAYPVRDREILHRADNGKLVLTMEFKYIRVIHFDKNIAITEEKRFLYPTP